MNEPESLLTYRQASARLGIAVNTLYALVHERRIPHVRLGRRFVRFVPAELDAWVVAHRVGAISTGAGSGDESR